jgi:hypothetical protein
MKFIFRTQNKNYTFLKRFYNRSLLSIKKLPFLKKGNHYNFFIVNNSGAHFNIRGQLIYRRFRTSFNTSVSLMSKISKEKIIFTLPLYIPRLGF